MYPRSKEKGPEQSKTAQNEIAAKSQNGAIQPMGNEAMLDSYENPYTKLAEEENKNGGPNDNNGPNGSNGPDDNNPTDSQSAPEEIKENNISTGSQKEDADEIKEIKETEEKIDKENDPEKIIEIIPKDELEVIVEDMEEDLDDETSELNKAVIYDDPKKRKRIRNRIRIRIKIITNRNHPLRSKMLKKTWSL